MLENLGRRSFQASSFSYFQRYPGPRPSALSVAVSLRTHLPALFPTFCFRAKLADNDRTWSNSARSLAKQNPYHLPPPLPFFKCHRQPVNSILFSSIYSAPFLPFSSYLCRRKKIDRIEKNREKLLARITHRIYFDTIYIYYAYIILNIILSYERQLRIFSSLSFREKRKKLKFQRSGMKNEKLIYFYYPRNIFTGAGK